MFCRAPTSRLLRVLRILLLPLLVATFARSAGAATKIEALVIGNNRAPVHANAGSSDRDLPTLRFADDDAAAFYEFIMQGADGGHLLTLMDRDTQALYPSLVQIAKSPSLSEVKLAVAEIRQRLEQYKREGHRSVVLVFFSGHGSLDAAGVPELALADGGLTQKVLYDDILQRLPADVVHLLVDACHAEAVVRPRDTESQTVNVTANAAHAALVQSTLLRFPSAGAILAAASDGQAHEWDRLRQGVFTYELLSALRGAADVNRDGRVEYSEVYAFLSAANRGIDDPRARLAVVARPPDSDRRAPIIEFSRFATSNLAQLTEIPASAGAVQVDDELGRHLATVHNEPSLSVTLLLPAQRTIYVRAGESEAYFRTEIRQKIAFRGLRFSQSPSRPRGSWDVAIRRGLFASEFGRGYYSGFVDRAPEFVAVPWPEAEKDTKDQTPARERPVAKTGARNVVLGVGVADAVARQLSVSRGLRLGLRPQRRSGLAVSLDASYASATALGEWRTLGSIGWLWGASFGASSGFIGVSVGGGLLLQAPDAGSSRASFVGTIAPSLGITTRLGRHFSLWSEAEVSVQGYRRDADTVASLAPILWLGGALGL